ncbi:MAG: hypothetical protein ACYTHJ_12245 [Planctomycetota bacterium]
MSSTSSENVNGLIGPRRFSPNGGDMQNAYAANASTPAEAQREQIVTWLTQAMSDSVGDAYTGKRDQKRFRDEFELEAVLDLKSDHPQLLATMHNICETGIAFWVRNELDVGRSLFLRTYGCGDSATWVEVKISHCTRGIRGYIVGASFTHPVSTFVPPVPQPDDQTASAPEPADDHAKSGGLLGWLGLRKN